MTRRKTAQKSAEKHEYTYRFPSQGLGRDQEAAFRDGLFQWQTTWAFLLPPSLRAKCVEYLFRTDGMGLSLCFDGPQRDVLFAEVWEWLRQQSPDVQQSAMPTLTMVEQQGRHGHPERWNDLPPFTRTPVPTSAARTAPPQADLFANTAQGALV